MPPSPPDIAAGSAKARLKWIDLYRGLAVVVMIEAHVVNTFLAPVLRTTAWFGWVNYANGLIAPAFLFIAGYALALGVQRAGKVGDSRRRLRRLAVIAMIGYALHFPWAQLQARAWGEAWRAGTIVDILPCLAASLAVLTLAIRLAGKTAPWVALGLLAAVVVSAPHLANFTSAPVPLRAYLNWTTGSLFPLFPWAGFAFAGFATAAFSQQMERISFLLPGLAALGCGGLVWLLGRGDLSAASPVFFVERLAWILAFVLVSQAVAACWTPGPLRFAGQESLALYVIHLLLISNLQPHLFTLGPAPTLVLYAAVLVASLALTLTWRTFNVWRADRTRRATHLRESSAPAT